METQEFTPLKRDMKSKKIGPRSSGQAVIEFVLLLTIILLVSGALITGVASTRDKMWKRMLCVISAACADCKSTESAKKAAGSGVSCKN